MKFLSYMPVLTGIRAIAVSLVFIRHYTIEADFHDDYTWGIGQTGVAIFFVLSGFLMMHITNDNEISSKRILKYYLDRFARIYPGYIAVIFIWLLFNSYFNIEYFGLNQSNYFLQILMISGHGVFWTIPIEFMFYLIFPLIWFLSQSTSKSSFITVVFFSIIVLILLRKNGWLAKEFDIQFLNILYFMAFFLAGSIIQLLYKIELPRMLCELMFGLSLILGICTLPYFMEIFTGKKILIWNSMESLLIVCFFIFFSLRSVISSYILASKITTFIGKISYSMYLTHHFVLFFAFRVEPVSVIFRGSFLQKHPISLGVLLFSLSVILAWIFYTAIENPSRNFLKKITKRALLVN